VYFLLSLRNFIQEWYDNLLPAVSRDNPEVKKLEITLHYSISDLINEAPDWCPHRTYGSLMSLSVRDVVELEPGTRMVRIFERSKAFKKNQKKVKKCAANSVSFPCNTPLHKREKQKPLHRSVKKTLLTPEHIRAEATPDTGRITCEKCQGLPEDEKCIRNYFVDEHPDPKALEGIVLTNAAPGDRVTPKVILLINTLYVVFLK